MDILHRLNREDGRTIVMVTHNEEQARQTSRTIRFFDGRRWNDGSSAQPARSRPR